jgi:arylsulfatase
VHGFEGFFGNLYHLNAEEEPENEDYPKDPKFRKTFGPRGVLKCKATDKDDATVDEAFGRVGKQEIENTGALDTKRMETVDEEFLASTFDFLDRKSKEGRPWFCYVNPTRMHVWTHLKPSSKGKTGLGVYPERRGIAAASAFPNDARSAADGSDLGSPVSGVMMCRNEDAEQEIKSSTVCRAD